MPAIHSAFRLFRRPLSEQAPRGSGYLVPGRAAFLTVGGGLGGDGLDGFLGACGADDRGFAARGGVKGFHGVLQHWLMGFPLAGITPVLDPVFTWIRILFDRVGPG